MRKICDGNSTLRCIGIYFQLSQRFIADHNPFALQSNSNKQITATLAAECHYDSQKIMPETFFTWPPGMQKQDK